MDRFPPFRPPWWLRNGHANTIYSFLRPRGVKLAPAQSDWIVAEPGVELLLVSHWQPRPAPALLLVHGLEGSSHAGYMQTTTALALATGWHVIRMNVRGCGLSEERCATLYNSGMSADVGKTLAWVLGRPNVEAAVLAGFSMGGNLVLKYAGEVAETAPGGLMGVAAVSPCLDLAPSADALNRSVNYFYQRRFLKSLKLRLQRHAVRRPGRYPIERLDEITSIRAFDDIVVAPNMGYRDADDYYFRASAARVLDRIRVPTLVLHAEDDPFIVITPTSRRLMAANPAIQFHPVRWGGHCGFINGRSHEPTVYWGESRVVQFARETYARTPVPHAGWSKG